MKGNILITICARGGSKGIPKKNVRLLARIPLIAYSIKHAKAFAKKYAHTDIELSTDDSEILSIAAKYGLNTDYVRPYELATDKAGKVAVIEDLLKYKESQTQKTYDIILDLDVSSPLRTLPDLEQAYEKIKSDKDAYNIFSVSLPHRNPYFNIVEEKKTGYYGLVKPGTSLSRQQAPLVFDMNASFYFYRRIFFDEKFTTVMTDKSLIYLMEHVCFDLDEILDFEIMEFLLLQDKLGFKI